MVYGSFRRVTPTHNVVAWQHHGCGAGHAPESTGRGCRGMTGVLGENPLDGALTSHKPGRCSFPPAPADSPDHTGLGWRMAEHGHPPRWGVSQGCSSSPSILGKTPPQPPSNERLRLRHVPRHKKSRPSPPPPPSPRRQRPAAPATLAPMPAPCRFGMIRRTALLATQPTRRHPQPPQTQAANLSKARH